MGGDIEVKTGKFIPHEFYDTYFSEFEDAKKRLCANCIGRIKNMEQWVRREKSRLRQIERMKEADIKREQ